MTSFKITSNTVEVGGVQSIIGGPEATIGKKGVKPLIKATVFGVKVLSNKTISCVH